MTFLSRKKRRTTARATSRITRTTASLLALGLLLAVNPVQAQQLPAGMALPIVSSAPASPTEGVIFTYTKAAGVPAAPEPRPGRIYYFRKTAAQPSPSLPPASQQSSNARTLALQQPPPRRNGARPDPRLGADESPQYQIPLEVPGRERIVGQLDTEEELKERMRQDARNQGLERIIFPDEPVVSKEPYRPRAFPAALELVEPNYVCHGRLYFEEKNSERYGWDLGIIQPVVSTGAFALDLAFLPYHAFTEPCRCYECSAGHCLPGDAVPYLLYPPELSWTGAAAEAGAIAGLLAVFP